MFGAMSARVGYSAISPDSSGGVLIEQAQMFPFGYENPDEFMPGYAPPGAQLPLAKLTPVGGSETGNLGAGTI
eukprot:IDg7678t1